MVRISAFASGKGSGTASEASFEGTGAFNSSSIIVGKTMASNRRKVGINSCIGMDTEQAAGPTQSFRFSYRSMGGALSCSSLQVRGPRSLLEGSNFHLTYFTQAVILKAAKPLAAG